MLFCEPLFPLLLWYGRLGRLAFCLLCLPGFSQGAETFHILSNSNGIALDVCHCSRTLFEGEPLTVRTRRGSMRAPARLVTTIRPDAVFVPFHWVGANKLTNDALDPSSRMPEFKVCAAEVRA